MHNLVTKNTTKQTERLILGMDPGTNLMGFGLLLVKGQKLELVEMGVFNLKKLESQQEKLQVIFDESNALIRKHRPTELAIEAPFFGKNVQSMLKLGRAQGVAIAAALNHSMRVEEYSPKKIKQSITGNGNASKEQVSAMIMNLLKLKEHPKYLDESDAVAVAICHYFQKNSVSSKKSYSGWESFVKQNPTRKKS